MIDSAPGSLSVLPSSYRCKACGADGLLEVARSLGIPVQNARVFATETDARSVATGDLLLSCCPACGFLQNAVFDPSRVVYEDGYEEQQSFSPTFTSFADGLVRELVEGWDLRGKRVVEIGCGKGDFLASLCELGGNTGLGIDPTAVPSRLGDRPGVTLVRDFYATRPMPLDADAIVCRHTLEHVGDVAGFVRAVRESIGDRAARIFFEVPDAMRVLNDGAFWDVYYEHCSYFTCGTLARLFRNEGFTVDSVRLGYDDQYVLLEASLPASHDSGVRSAAEETPETVELAAAAYAQRVSDSIAGWRRRIDAEYAAGGRVAVWGSGSKCVAFLCETGLAHRVDAIVDINPHRQGRYLPGSGRRIDAPSVLTDVRPTLVVPMNAIYRDEIAQSLREMRVDTVVEAL